jgi:hypothetical protein
MPRPLRTTARWHLDRIRFESGTRTARRQVFIGLPGAVAVGQSVGHRRIRLAGAGHRLTSGFCCARTRDRRRGARPRGSRRHTRAPIPRPRRRRSCGLVAADRDPRWLGCRSRLTCFGSRGGSRRRSRRRRRLRLGRLHRFGGSLRLTLPRGRGAPGDRLVRRPSRCGARGHRCAVAAI